MTSSEAVRLLGPVAALWPNLNTARRKTVWQGLNTAEQQAVAVLFGRDNCLGLPPELPQDENCATGDNFSEYRARWQAAADAGQHEVKHKKRKHKMMEAAPVMDTSRELRQRWQQTARSTQPVAQVVRVEQPEPTAQAQPKYSGGGLWQRIKTALVCICMTPIPYVLIALWLWYVCSH